MILGTLLRLLIITKVFLAYGQIIDTSYPIIFTDNFALSSQSLLTNHFGYSTIFVKPSLREDSAVNRLYPAPQAW